MASGEATMTSNATAGAETRVNTYTTGYQAEVSLTGLADGGWIATWTSAQNAQDIHQQRYDADGAVVGSETLVNTVTAGSEGFSSVTGLSDGGWLVVWMSIDGQDEDDVENIRQQRYDVDGVAVGSETAVNTYTAFSQRLPETTALAGGGWVVTWESYGQDGDSYGIYQQRYSAIGATVGLETRVNSITTDGQFTPTVAALADGGWIVAWQSAEQGQGDNVIQQRYNAAGEAVETDALVNTVTANNQGRESVTGLTDGGWVVAWQSAGQDGSDSGIFQQRYDADGDTVGVETQVNTYTTGDQDIASVTALSDGGWVVVWRSGGQDGSSTGIYQQRYDADGTAAGTETLVNAYTTGFQNRPAVTALDDGSWVVSWSSEGQDGDDYGVYQRHFAPDRIGTTAAETLSGTNWSETLSGDSGADTLKGFCGIDIIDGGKSRDRLYGGADADTFLFETGDSGKTKAKADTIFDMTHADQIDLHLIDAQETLIDDQAFKFIGTKQFTGQEDELRYEKLKSDTYIYGDTDGDGKADFTIHLDDAIKLKAGDFAL
jgi:riboflavin biosynthesis pyrimidine reductase